MAISLQQLLVVQKVLPADVARVIVQQDNTPLRHRLLLAMALPRPPVNAHRRGGCAALDQGPGIARMAQPLMETMLTGPAPVAVPPHGPRASPFGGRFSSNYS
jgi:hypothetical protein